MITVGTRFTLRVLQSTHLSAPYGATTGGFDAWVAETHSNNPSEEKPPVNAPYIYTLRKRAFMSLG